MNSMRLAFAMAFLSGAALARAGDTYWQHDPATPGDWLDPANWTAGVPTINDKAYIDNGGTALISSGAAVASSQYVGYTGTGAIVQTGGTNAAHSEVILGQEAGSHGSYEIRGGTLWSDRTIYVGYGGEGVFRHLAGRVTADPSFQYAAIYVGGGVGSSGTYDLSGPGQLVSRYILVGAEGNGLFRQSAGSVDVDYRLFVGSGYTTGTGRYELSGGTVSTHELIVGKQEPGRFAQTGGTCSVEILRIQDMGRYELGGGKFVLSKGSEITGEFSFAGGGLIQHTGGVLDLTRGTFTGDPSAISYVGSGLALLIHPPGFQFGSFSTTALTQVPGQKLVVPPGKGFTGPAQIYGHVHNEGHIELWHLEYGQEVGIFGGLFNTNGGYIYGYGRYEIEDEISGIDSGYVTVGDTSIGQHGTGRFTQSGGEFVARFDLFLGYAAGARGTYVMTGGKCHALLYLVVGESGTGSFQQTGGRVKTYSLIVGRWSGSEGTYELGGDGYLDADYQNVGLNGRGRVVQTGGQSHARKLWLGVKDGAKGTYELHGGSLSAGEVLIGIGDLGRGGLGRFIQTGGTHTGNPEVGAGSTGRYELHGGTLDGSVAVGQHSTGEFLHTGGTVNGGIIVGGETNGNGTYEFQGGTINAQYISISHAYHGNATGRFIQTGGIAQVAQRVQLGYRKTTNQALLSISGGGLSTPELSVGVAGSNALFEIADPDASIAVSEWLGFYSGAEFSAVPGATIHMTGAEFKNESTSSENLAGLKNLKLIFEGGSGGTDPFEVAGADNGGNWEAFHENFTLGTLQLGGADVGQVQLVDNYDNLPGAEALYLRRLTVGHGSTLDLNGLNVYCLDFSNNGVITGGAVTQVAGIDSVNAAFLASGFDASAGVLTVSDAADIVVESAAGQVTYAGGGFALTATLQADHSTGGLASALFRGGSVVVTDSAASPLLAGYLADLALHEVVDGSGLLAGSGYFDVTGGVLEEAFGQAYGEVVQITFQIDPADIDDFTGDFTGVSNITLTPIPEPAALALLGLGVLGLLRRRRARKRGLGGLPRAQAPLALKLTRSRRCSLW